MFDIDSILQPYKDECNNTLPDEVISALGLTGDDITTAEGILKPVFDADSWNSIKQMLQGAVDALSSTTTAFTNSGLAQQNATQQSIQAQQVAASTTTQDAEVSQTFPEPSVETRVTSPTDLADADNSLAEDYPSSFGYTDECGNFYKINRTTGFVQFVHKTGTCVKIDGEGNVTIHSVGSAKLVVDKDLAIQAKNIDMKADNIALTSQETKIKADNQVQIETMVIDASTPMQVKLDAALVTGTTFKASALVSAPVLAIG